MDPQATPLDWPCIIALQSLSMISILSTTYLFSTAVFMVQEWGATDEARRRRTPDAHRGEARVQRPELVLLGHARRPRRVPAHDARLSGGHGGAHRGVGGRCPRAAVVLRALGGFFDGVMTLSKSAMAKISDRASSARALARSAPELRPGLRRRPAVARCCVTVRPGDPNARDPTGPTRRSPSGAPRTTSGGRVPSSGSAWVLVVGAALWAYAFVRLRIGGGAASGTRRGTEEPEEERERAVEMTETNAAAEGNGNAERSPARPWRW